MRPAITATPTMPRTQILVCWFKITALLTQTVIYSISGPKIPLLGLEIRAAID